MTVAVAATAAAAATVATAVEGCVGTFGVCREVLVGFAQEDQSCEVSGDVAAARTPEGADVRRKAAMGPEGQLS